MSLTNEEHLRLTEAFLAKAKRMGPEQGWGDRDGWLRAIIGTVVADTMLVVEGTIPIEAYEDPDWRPS